MPWDGKATLYLAGHEITANADGSVASAVRTYTFDGVLVATRSLAGVDYLVSDAAGSVETSAPSGGAPSATRAYVPYGRVRAQSGQLDTARGFVGQEHPSLPDPGNVLTCSALLPLIFDSDCH